MHIEIWKPIIGFEKYYLVSNTGKIKSLRRNKLRSLTPNTKGYLQISLSGDLGAKITVFRIHRLVGEYFIPNPNNLPQLNHLDGDKNNNNNWNLAWCTNRENCIHAFEHGLRKSKAGIDVYNSRFTTDNIREIRDLLKSGIYKHVDIAKKFNVSKSVITAINTGRSYKSVA